MWHGLWNDIIMQNVIYFRDVFFFRCCHAAQQIKASKTLMADYGKAHQQ